MFGPAANNRRRPGRYVPPVYEIAVFANSGGNGIVYRSTYPFTSWSTRTIASSMGATIECVAFDGVSRWVLGCSSGKVFAGDDLAGTFTEQADFGTMTVDGMAYGNARFICVTDPGGLAHGVVKMSEDGGATWADVHSPVMGQLYSVAYHEPTNTFVVGGEFGACYSPDGGDTWINSTGDGSINGFGVCYGLEEWVMVGESGYTIASPLGDAWVSRGNPGLSLSFLAVSYWNNRLISVSNGSGSNDSVRESLDKGATWTVVLAGSAGGTWRDTVALDDIQVALDVSERLYWSENGGAWTLSSIVGAGPTLCCCILYDRASTP